MNDKLVKKAYYLMFLDNFTKEKIADDSTLWYISEHSSNKCVIRSKTVNDISFIIRYGGNIWGYEIGVDLMVGKHDSKYFDINSIVILYNQIDYYKIKRAIKHMHYVEENGNKKRKVDILLDKLPVDYKRAMKIKSL